MFIYIIIEGMAEAHQKWGGGDDENSYSLCKPNQIELECYMYVEGLFNASTELLCIAFIKIAKKYFDMLAPKIADTHTKL